MLPETAFICLQVSVLKIYADLSFSEIQNLIIDCLVTPSLDACRSSMWIIHSGKSTETRLVSEPGRFAFLISRYPVISTSFSKRSSNSCVVINFSFIFSRFLTEIIRIAPFRIVKTADHIVLFQTRDSIRLINHFLDNKPYPSCLPVLPSG